MKSANMILSIFFSAVSGSILILALVLFMYSPGKPDPFLDAYGKPLAKKYFEELHVPLKGFYTFEQSAHSPLFEEPGRMRQILKNDVLEGKSDLAD